MGTSLRYEEFRNPPVIKKTNEALKAQGPTGKTSKNESFQYTWRSCNYWNNGVQTEMYVMSQKTNSVLNVCLSYPHSIWAGCSHHRAYWGPLLLFPCLLPSVFGFLMSGHESDSLRGQPCTHWITHFKSLTNVSWVNTGLTMSLKLLIEFLKLAPY